VARTVPPAALIGGGVPLPTASVRRRTGPAVWSAGVAVGLVLWVLLGGGAQVGATRGTVDTQARTATPEPTPPDTDPDPRRASVERAPSTAVPSTVPEQRGSPWTGSATRVATTAVLAVAVMLVAIVSGGVALALWSLWRTSSREEAPSKVE